ncbi:MAG: phosphoribosylamine--glycine ligase [Chloroflexota bacterium]|nr:phosphoribosylamine--glycine ligase [Chloroflexota bacterium]
MRLMVVGSGGREHALTWKLVDSSWGSRRSGVGRVFVVPGNGGTAAIAENVPIAADDIPALVSFGREKRIDLTIVGPEAPLVGGLVDAFKEAGLRTFGPTAAAARLEGSKAFAKRFMVEEGIPTAVGASFHDYETALAYLRQQGAPVVVKASGLAAGKGVAVCSTLEDAEAALHRAMVERHFGEAGDEVLVEECLIGEEASLLAFSDGRTVVPMLPARDYKRAHDGDRGLNTGGMGCYAPSPHLPPTMVDEVLDRVLQPAVDGMHRRGTPYVGVLYAGLMLTDDGPRVLEFNCRFGDPEAQVILPLLESDLVDVLLACLDGRLDETEVRWRSAHTVCVVKASGGYPTDYQVGKTIVGVEDVEALPDTVVFQAGTERKDGALLTAGGRVLAVTGIAPALDEAREKAYAGVERIDFEGAQYRSDVAAGVPSSGVTPRPGGGRGRSAYAAAGVDIEAGNRAVELMREAVHSTYTPAVLTEIGSFGGLFALKDVLQAHDPVLVCSTDGVGTKTMIAAAMGRYDTVGHDIVNHCINDVLVQGARPLFFLDYIAAGRLDPEQIATIVAGCAEACRASGCALVGGETAEMPGVYRPETFDLVGTLVGWVERDAIVDGRDVEPGDVCLGLRSTGLHTNGYSLARRAFSDVAEAGWDAVLPELGRPVGEVLLIPHKAYLGAFDALVEAEVTIKAMAHITGGGFVDNVPRVLPRNVGAVIDRRAWDVPAIFRLIQRRGGVDEMEMYHVFNMGIGMVVIVDEDEIDAALGALKEEAVVIGEIVPWDGYGPRVSL